MFHQHIMVRADSLHLFDGGGTMRHLILLGDWLHMQGKEFLTLANERLAAMVRLDDFTHFSQSRAQQRSRVEVTWRSRAAAGRERRTRPPRGHMQRSRMFDTGSDVRSGELS